MIPTATPLLATKFYIPPPSLNLVHRPRLLALLDTGLSQPGGFTRKLTLVSAPAGYGKTTLVAEWLHRCGEAEQAGQMKNLHSPGSPWTTVIMTRRFSCLISSPRSNGWTSTSGALPFPCCNHPSRFLLRSS